MLKQLSIYIHYPFCESKCPYCDFNSHVENFIDHQAFLKAYCRELEYFASRIGKRKITSIFFGGGTPSLMPIFLLAGILEKISELFMVDDDCEISLEANPSSSESKKFKEFKNLGINRLSLGIQALNDDDLKFLGRKHNADEAIKAINLAQENFTNFSFDLIYARPKQTILDWSKELKKAIEFSTKHLSLYQLTIEKGTQFFSDFNQQKFIMPDENLASEFYEITNQIMIGKGFEHYEVSNYAQKNYQSRHNLAYWLSYEYIGIGAGAHSRICFENKNENKGNFNPRNAIMMIHHPQAWLQKVLQHGNGIQTLQIVENRELIEEIILMGLRLKEGIKIKKIEEIIGKKFNEIFDLEKLKKLQDQNFLIIDEEKIVIPQNKWLIMNSIISKVIDAINLIN
jgi:oxygen-independent coproporphyrinogen-3 oxidase